MPTLYKIKLIKIIDVSEKEAEIIKELTDECQEGYIERYISDEAFDDISEDIEIASLGKKLIKKLKKMQGDQEYFVILDT